MHMRALLLWLLLALLAACSKTVTWEEEVPLNTGDTIWVKRHVTYKLKGDAGNPFDMAYRPDWTETLEFEWQGKKYSYTGDAALMLLAISPINRKPILLANAMLKGWYNNHNYRCVKPFYVQFLPDATGQEWTWLTSIEPWMYSMNYNMMIHRPLVKDVKSRYLSSERVSLDRVTAVQSPYLVHVDQNYESEHCKQQGDKNGN